MFQLSAFSPHLTAILIGACLPAAIQTGPAMGNKVILHLAALIDMERIARDRP